MSFHPIHILNPYDFPSPSFVTDIAKLRYNANILDNVQKKTGVKILLALKAFSQWKAFPILSRSMEGPLYGACASSLDEARLAKEEFKGEVHAFAAAFSLEEMPELLPLIDHITFNSLNQWKKFRPLIHSYCKENNKNIACGLRVNPEHSEGTVPIYDPCDPSSRLGIRLRDLQEELSVESSTQTSTLKEDNQLSNHSAYTSIFDGLSGLHFHTLCEQNADAFARTLLVFEEKFGSILSKMQWVNFGGGHHITREDYNIDLLCDCILRIQKKYNVQTYLEPGEAVALDAGFFVSTVLDTINADMPMAILDCSAACHMPDVMEMPYRPNILRDNKEAGKENEKNYSYRLAGKSCLAGDVIHIYSFDTKLKEGERLVFQDMAIYSMVKTNTFNGLRLPSIVLWDSSSNTTLDIVNFNYENFKKRLS